MSTDASATLEAECRREAAAVRRRAGGLAKAGARVLDELAKGFDMLADLARRVATIERNDAAAKAATAGKATNAR
jgi:hypothetical protein